METKHILLASLLLLPLGALAQKIEVKNAVIDCGQVAYQSPVSVDFELRNKANHAVKIKDVKVSCGCTTVDYPTDEIKGGETFTMRVTYDAMTMGHFNKVVGVYSDADDKPMELRVKGVVVEEVVNYAGTFPFALGEMLVDKNDIEFDDVNSGEQPQQVIHIRNASSTTIQPQVMHLPNYLKADVSPTKLKPSHDGVITITLDSRSLHDFGLTQTSIFLGQFPGDKVSQDKEITVSAVLLPNFEKLTPQQLALAPKIQLSSPELNLPAFNGKKKQRGTIIIKNTGKSKLHISSLRMFTSALQLSLNTTTIAPGAEAKLKITVDADKLKGARSKPRVLMITNDPDNPKVTININVAE